VNTTPPAATKAGLRPTPREGCRPSTPPQELRPWTREVDAPAERAASTEPWVVEMPGYRFYPHMDQFINKHTDKIVGTLGCFDRVIFRGYLPIWSGYDMFDFLALPRKSGRQIVIV
jgi:hypothetical protein